MKVFVDRLEGEWAVLTPLGRDTPSFHVRRQALPSGVREGSVLTVSFSIDMTETERAGAEVEALYRELPNEP